MKFKISNLGYIKNGEIEVGDFTLICGKNNTGKTYINYAIYGFLKFWNSRIDFEIEEEIKKLFEKGVLRIDLSKYQEKFANAIDKFSRSYSSRLPFVFSIDKDCLSDALLIAKLDDFKPSYIDDDYELELNSTLAKPNQEPILQLNKPKGSNILEVILLITDQENIPPAAIIEDFVNTGIGSALAEKYFPDAFIITSERTGIALFYKELDISKNIMIERIARMDKRGKQVTPFDFMQMFEDSISRYSQPVQDEIDLVRDLDNFRKKTGALAEENPEIISYLKDIVGGEYRLENYSMSFVFKPKRKNTKIPLHSASLTVKSLLDLYFYLQHIAQPGDLLMIDEPELNLHPENQRKLAKLFTRLVNCGLRLLMTTHSDYLIKELNNLIVLSNEFEDKSSLMEQYNYTDQDILDPKRIKVYITEDNTINPAKITPLGIEVPTFDEEIIKMNNFYDEVTNHLDIAYDY